MHTLNGGDRFANRYGFATTVAVLVATNAYAVDADLIRDLAFRRHEGDPAAFEVIENDRGEVLSIVGSFPDESANKDSPLAQVDSFFDSLDMERPTLRAVESQPIDGNTLVVRFDQFVHGLRADDASVSATFDRHGYLTSINGPLLPQESERVLPELNHVEILQELVALGVATPVEEARWVEVSPNRWENETGYSIEYVWISRDSAPIWRYTDKRNTVDISDFGKLIDIRSLIRAATGPCNIRTEDLERDSAGYTTRFVVDGTRTEHITCEASEWFGECYWQLRRESDLSQHQVGRVMDADGGELQVRQACSSSDVPQFTGTGTGGDSLREQTAFYVGAQMRHFMNQNTWQHVSPSRAANVQITVDSQHYSGSTNSYVPGWYDPIFTDIGCDNEVPDLFGVYNGCTIETLAHEYGHYVSDTYGSFSSECNGSNHGYSIEETVASVYGMLFLMDDDQTLPRYSAGDGLLGNLDGPHTSDSQGKQFQMQCEATTSPTEGTRDQNRRISGFAFSQAVWEILWNRNCNIDNCTDGQTTNGTRIFTSLNREAVMEQVGAALAYANSVLGPNATFQQVTTHMRVKVQSDIDLNTAIRMRAVFAHHNL